jgi:hypothetical protein
VGGEWGRTIINGQVQYLSASAMTTADPNSYGGCARRYHFKYAAQKKEPTTKAMTRGTTELHSPIEHYYKTGQRAFTQLVLNIQQFLYERDPRILVELQMAGVSGNVEHCDVTTESQSKATAALARSAFRIQDVPIVGKIDLLQAMGVYIDARGELRPEPNKRTIEVKDWKSTKSWEYAKSPHDLANNIQMDMYDAFARFVRPTTEYVRRSHVYSLTGSGEERGRKVTILASPEHSARRWEYVGGVARLILDVAKVPADQSNSVDGNAKSCEAYGGCPHASYCTIGGRTSLFSASAIMSRPTEPLDGVLAELEGDPPVSLLKRSATAPAATVTTLPASQGVGVAIAVDSNMIDALLAEEESPSAASADPNVQRYRAVFDALKEAGMGEPVFEGPVAAARADWGKLHGENRVYTGAPFPGTGKLAGLQKCDTFERLLAIGADMEKFLAKKRGTAAPKPEPVVEVKVPPQTVKVTHIEQPVSILPEETPESNPALASVPVEGFATPGTAPTVELEPSKQDITTATLIAASGTATETTSKRRGRKPKTQGDVIEAARSRELNTDETQLVLYHDCMPSVEFENLQPLVDQWCRSVAVYYQADPPDIRCAQQKPLSFGGWKGVVAAIVHDQIDKVPRGNLFLRGSEINDVVAEAMHATGKLDNYVRGLK